MTSDSRMQKLKEAFDDINGLLNEFKNSEASDLPKDLKFYRTVYGTVTVPALNSVMVNIHALEEKLCTSFLPKRYASGSVKVFNNHQLEMIVSSAIIVIKLFFIF
jgi:hypothetical protein